jgi:DNA (cytosine-5)-methyltransferase 1
MGAYYNEHDPFAAAWLRELMKANLIAPGEVDERSIEDVQPSDLKGFTQCHFFAGIGVWSYALRAAGWPDDSPVWTGSCPCQSFSTSGKGEGFSDKRHLWPAWFRLVSKCGPHTIFGEQVASPAGLAWFDVVSADLERKSYAIGAADLCAAGVGAPHIRQRLWWVANAECSTPRRPGKARHECRAVKRPHRLRSTDQLEYSKKRRGGTYDRESSASDEREISDRRRGISNKLARDQDANRKPNAELSITPSSMVNASINRLPDDLHQPGNGACSNETQSELQYADSGRCSTKSVNELANTDGSRLHRPGQVQPTRWNGDSVGRSEADELDHAIRNGRRASGNNNGSDERLIVHSTGPTNGFWQAAEWLYCRDGKCRPVEPGVAPLVTGAPSRVGRLRGYGNALCAPVAQAFIESYLDIDR